MAMMSLVFTMQRMASYYKLKTHSGVKKRIKIIGAIHERQFKFYPAGKQHLMNNKSANNLNRKKPRVLECPGDIKRLKKVMPYWKYY